MWGGGGGGRPLAKKRSGTSFYLKVKRDQFDQEFRKIKVCMCVCGGGGGVLLWK